MWKVSIENTTHVLSCKTIQIYKWCKQYVFRVDLVCKEELNLKKNKRGQNTHSKGEWVKPIKVWLKTQKILQI